MKFALIIEVDEPEFETDEDREDWVSDVSDGLTSVDMEGAIRECLDSWYTETGEDGVTLHDAREAQRKWRVQVELRGKPAKFYVSAPDKDAAKVKVQDQLGPADFVFTRTYELPFWQAI